MPGTIGDPRLAVPRRRLRKLRERLMPSQRTLIVLAREHSRYERRAARKENYFYCRIYAFPLCIFYFVTFYYAT